jgi:putative ABC transport system permease protein
MKQVQQILRGLNRNRLNSSVIIISLALGMACFFLISVFIQHELNPDSFNPDKNRTFALQSNNPYGAVGGSSTKMLYNRYGSAEYMKENIAEVESFCRIANSSAKRIKVNRNLFFEQPIVLDASSNFFEFFNYKLLSRNEQTVLETKNDIAISKELALKYFGEVLPIGKSIQITFKNEEKEFFVTGVFERPVAVTLINFDMVTLFEGERNSRCFVKLDSPSSRLKMEEEFERLKDEIPIIKGDESNQYSLLPIHEAYFSSMRRSVYDATRDKSDLWIAAIVALMILGIAIFNYLILIKNRLNDNAKNYTINRIQGAANNDLVLLFMRETFAMLFISLGFGMVLLKLFVPYFNELLTTTITASVFIQFDSLTVFVLLLSLVGVITYFFVLVHLRTQLSITNIKGSNQPIHRKIHGMNIIQLAAMVILVIASSVVIKQIQFINNKEIGLDKNVTVVKIPQTYQEKAEVFKEELRANPNTRNIALTLASPLLPHFVLLLKYNDNGVEKEYYPNLFSGDANFIKTLGIKILEGEDFSGIPEVDKRKCLINKSLANMFPNQKLIGESMPGNPNKTIIGIVEDFHFTSLKRKVEPGFIEYNDEGPNILVKAKDGLENEVLASIAAIWAKLIPDYPVNFENLDVRYKSLHDENKNFIRLIGSCSLISIFLSMMGLFAISVDKCIKRTKEIGIRKVNGAKISEILNLLNKDFIKWVVIAFLIACPIAYYAMNKWLENFAYKTTLSWWIFVLAGGLALGIALLTVSFQSYKAATRNPIESLRYE